MSLRVESDAHGAHSGRDRVHHADQARLLGTKRRIPQAQVREVVEAGADGEHEPIHLNSGRLPALASERRAGDHRHALGRSHETADGIHEGDGGRCGDASGVHTRPTARQAEGHEGEGTCRSGAPCHPMNTRRHAANSGTVGP